MSDEQRDELDIIEETGAEEEEWIVVFRGDLYTCRERHEEMLDEEITAEIITAEMSVEGMPPVFEIVVHPEDIDFVVTLFKRRWKETLSTEGLDDEEIEELEEEVIDLTQDTIICPGCKSEISEITEEGECIECGLFLGFPEEDEEEE